jgi:hypothetical protein
MARPLLAWIVLLAAPVASAQQPRAPRSQVPPTVLSEVAQLQSRFELALSLDCDAGWCFSKGCSYVDHSVADRPRATSLPGLGGDPGPGSVEPQAWLTQARCGFTYESEMASDDVQALVRRLGSRLSQGWLVVSIEAQALAPLPDHLKEPPAPDAAVEASDEAELAAAAAPPTLTMSVATRELWTSLLPHFWWMVGVGLVTLAGTMWIWAFRRVGRESVEERALLAQLLREEAEPAAPAEAPQAADEREDERAFVAQQTTTWRQRLAAMEPGRPEPEVQAMLRELLRAGQLDLLATAVLAFPDTLPAAFPEGGDVAAAKLALAERLKTADATTLVADAAFFRALNRHALSAALASQGDAELVRSLSEEFGPAGLSTLLSSLGPRPGALLFALSPALVQHELARLFSPPQIVPLAEQLLRSSRMSRAETAYLFQVLQAARAGTPPPPAPAAAEVADHGAPFDAARALSVLLPAIHPDQQAGLFGRALQRLHGTLPTWTRGILVPAWLLELPREARVDLLLEIDVQALQAWLSLLDADWRDALLEGAPNSLRASLGGASELPSEAARHALAQRGRAELAAGFQRQLARTGATFEQLLQPAPGGP